MTTIDAPTRYGYLAELLGDPLIEEIIVIGGERTFVVRNGIKELVNVVVDAATVRRIADQLLAGTGRRVDTASPIVCRKAASPRSLRSSPSRPKGSDTWSKRSSAVSRHRSP